MAERPIATFAPLCSRIGGSFESSKKLNLTKSEQGKVVAHGAWVHRI